MPLEESPSLNNYKQGLPIEKHRPRNQRKIAWTFIVFLSIITLSLALVLHLKNQPVEIFIGSGTITGEVVGERNQPVEAKIVILGTEIEGESNLEGYFEIQNVPAGNQSVVILYQGSGWEYLTTITPGQVTNIGKIKVIPTSEPNN